jgi:hypothetical protein
VPRAPVCTRCVQIRRRTLNRRLDLRRGWGLGRRRRRGPAPEARLTLSSDLAVDSLSIGKPQAVSNTQRLAPAPDRCLWP